MLKRSAILIILLIAAASAFPQNRAAEAAIRKVMDDQTVAWNRGDLEAFMAGYWHSEKLRFVSGDRITMGWQATLDNYKRSYATPALMGKLTFSDLDITVLSNDAAYVVGSWSLARDKDDPKGKFTLLWRKFRDGWKIVSDHSS